MNVMKSDNFEEIGGAVSKRELKIYWLVDISGSMVGEKIATVNRAIRAVIPELQDSSDENPEVQMNVRAMKFSNGAQWHTNETKIADFKWHDLDVEGVTDTGAAMKLMAKELTSEKMGQRAIPPVLILMSDGEATDDYDGGLNELLGQKWATKSVRLAIAIGSDANVGELAKFCSHPKENPPLVADRAADLVKFIKWASVDVSKGVSNNIINATSDAPVNIPLPPQPQVTIGGSKDDDDDVW
jgi:uncharacterized protein YegL